MSGQTLFQATRRVLRAIVIVVLLTSTGAIHGSGDPVFSARGMAIHLEPLIGAAAHPLAPW